MLAGLLQATLGPLQRFKVAVYSQTQCAGSRDSESVSVAWLSNWCRIQFQLCSITHLKHASKCPAEITNYVGTVPSSATRSGLQFADLHGTKLLIKDYL